MTMEATSAGLTTGTLGAFTVVHGAATQIALTGSTANLTSGATRVLTATIQDAAGNTVTSDNTTSSPSPRHSGAGTVTGTGNATAAAGVATKTITGALVGASSLEPPRAAPSPTGTLGPSPSSTAPAPQIVLTESGSTTAGDAHTLTATLKDASGNTVTSDNTTVVTFAKTGGAGTVTGLGTATATAGVATKSVTNQLAGQIDLDAQAAGLTTGTASYTIVIGPVSASTSTVNAAPSSVTNNGTDTTTITVTVLDAGGNPLSGKTVTLDDAGADSVISPASTTSNASGVATFTATSTAVETSVYTATADAVAITDTATVNFVFNDSHAADEHDHACERDRRLSHRHHALLPPGRGRLVHALERRRRRRLGPGLGDLSGGRPGRLDARARDGHHARQAARTSRARFSWTNAASGNFGIDVEAADAWTPPNTSTTTLNVTEDSTAPTGHSVTVTGGPVFNALSIPFVLGDGSDAGAGLNTASRSVTRQVASLTSGVCGSFSDDAFGVSSPDTGVMSGNCYRYVFTIADRVGNVSATATSAAVQVDSDAPSRPDAGRHRVRRRRARDRLDALLPPLRLRHLHGDGDGDRRAVRGRQGHLPGGRLRLRPHRLGRRRDRAVRARLHVERRRHGLGRADGHSARPGRPHRERQLHADGRLDRPGHRLHRSGRRRDARLERPRRHRDRNGRRRRRRRLGAVRGLRRRAVHADRLRGHDRAVQRRLGHELRLRRAEDAARDRDRQRRQHDRRHAQRRGRQGRRPAGHVDHRQAGRPGQRHDAGLRVHGDRDPGHLRVQRRRRPAGRPARPPSRSPPPSADGSRTFEVRATDAAGNTDPTQASYTWVVDATLPTGSLTAPGAGAAVAGSAVTVSSNSADGLSGVLNALFEVSPAAAGSWATIGVADTSAPYSVTWDTTALGDGDYDLRVTTRDVAGNAFVSALRTVVVDNTAPSLTVNADTTINIASPDPETIGATATDTGTGIDYVKFEQCNSPGATCGVSDWTTLTIDTTLPYSVAWPIPTDGVRLLAVTAVDNAGRQAYETVPVTIDRTAPTTALTAPVAAANLRGAAPVAASASDPAPGGVQLVEFQLTTNGGAYTDPSFASDASSPYTGSLDTTGSRRRPLRPPHVHERRLRQLDRLEHRHGPDRQHAAHRQRHGSGGGREPPRQRRWR